MKTWTYNTITYQIVDETKDYLLLEDGNDSYIIRKTDKAKPLSAINNITISHGKIENKELVSKLKPGQKFRFGKHGVLYIKIASDKNNAINAASYQLVECKDDYVYLED